VSLINEALRKARQAAAEHEEQQAQLRAPRAYPRRGRGAGPGAWLLVAVVAVLAAVAGGATVWWLVGRSPAAPPKEAAARSAEAAVVVDSPNPAADQPGPGVGPEETWAGGGGGEAQGTEPDSRPAGEPVAQKASDEVPTGTESRASARDRQTSDPGGSADESEPTRGSGAGPARRGNGNRIFVLDANIDGRSLSLGYIVLRHVRPFAEINGVDVYEGSEVEGFTVEKIEADRVILRDADGPLELRTK
jgi:hypothetical protein